MPGSLLILIIYHNTVCNPGKNIVKMVNGNIKQKHFLKVTILLSNLVHWVVNNDL